MANNGLAKISNVPFTRAQPDLCGYCQHYKAGAGKGFYNGFDMCTAKNKHISNAHSLKGKCAEFDKSPVQVATNEMIAIWKEDAESHQEWLKKRRG